MTTWWYTVLTLYPSFLRFEEEYRDQVPPRVLTVMADSPLVLLLLTNPGRDLIITQYYVEGRRVRRFKLRYFAGLSTSTPSAPEESEMEEECQANNPRNEGHSIEDGGGNCQKKRTPKSGQHQITVVKEIQVDLWNEE
ncbi:uncharacterized [Tachysurus ichikawai]